MKIVDIKTGKDSSLNIYQGAAYCLLVEENRPLFENMINSAKVAVPNIDPDLETFANEGGTSEIVMFSNATPPYFGIPDGVPTEKVEALLRKLNVPERPIVDEAHEWYTKAGKKYIPVSRVLEIVKKFNYPPGDNAEFGTYMHECTAIIDENISHNNPEALDLKAIKEMDNGDTILNYLIQWQRFKANEGLTGHRVAIECPLVSQKGFGGTLDRVYPDCGPDEFVFVFLQEHRYDVKSYNWNGIEMLAAKNEFLSFLATSRAKIGGF